MKLSRLKRSIDYADMSLRNRVMSPGGTINSSLFDDRGLVRAVCVGTNATGATQTDRIGDGAAGNNIVIVT
jgi:hypothetical protein